MTCPVCNQRKARRACPALGQQICTVCCGTKRLVEIRCPDGCGYLATARQHPAAVVQRQYVNDLEALRPTLQDLTEVQQQICLVLLSVVVRHGAAESLERILDEDVAHAAAALANTLDTAAKGVIYEHQPPSLPAQRLVSQLREVLDRLSRETHGPSLERDAAAALRGIERGVRAVPRPAGNPDAYMSVVRRLIRPYEPPQPVADERRPSGLVLPGGVL
jgi:AcrR family transcriptional regulator